MSQINVKLQINVVFFPSVFRKDCSPGPGYFIEASITRSGKDGTPNYSILGRQKDPSKYSYFLFLSGHSPELVTVSVRCHKILLYDNFKKTTF